MISDPYCPGFRFGTREVTLGTIEVKEIDEQSLEAILEGAREVQEKVSRIPIDERLEVLGKMGELWEAKVDSGELEGLAASLAKGTGYDSNLIEMEFSFVKEVLDVDNIRRNLDSSLPQGIRALDSFVDMGEGDSIRNVPAGPVLIISSGNSIVPPLIPTVISMVTGNLTILKPSLTNYEAIIEIMRLVERVGSDASRRMGEALVVSYFSHESSSLEYLLTEGNLGMVNFWGGEPARSEVGRRLATNPNHPAYFVNGPLTGVAIIDEASADRETAEGLALNIVLYDQQLCSSPTSAIFLGTFDKAMDFVSMVGEELDELGKDFKAGLDDDAAFLLQSARRYLQFNGSLVRSSNDPSNMWTVVLSRGKSALVEAVMAYPSLSVYSRKRFIEIVVVEDAADAQRIVDEIPAHPAFEGIDKVQTIGMAVTEENRRNLLERLAFSGVYRVVPLPDMFMRGPVEPYDGACMASLFTYALYSRKGSLELG